MPGRVSFNPNMKSNNRNTRKLQAENTKVNPNPWSKGQFVKDPNGVLREAARGDTSATKYNTNDEPPRRAPHGDYPLYMRRNMAARATAEGGPVESVLESLPSVVDFQWGLDRQLYAKVCDPSTAMCYLVVVAAAGVGALASAAAASMMGGKQQRRQTRKKRVHSKH
jgi:hypothetical protein